MGWVQELHRKQEGARDEQVSPNLTYYNENQRTFRCVHRGPDAVQVFRGCVGCPGNIKGYDCHSPVIRAKRRPRHICLITAPKLRERASEEGYFLCSSCKHREIFSLPSNPTWATGIVSAPRRMPTLHRSVQSLIEAGFNPTVFAEPDTNLEGIEVPVVQRETLHGAWTNWFTTLRDLVSQDDSDVILICQDDVIYSSGIRDHIEANWPKDAEIISFYCSAFYQSEQSPFIRSTPARIGFRGILAFAIARPIAERMLESVMLQKYGQQKGVDGVVGRWARTQGIDIFICNPSLAQHVGDTSTIYDSISNRGIRKSCNFVAKANTPKHQALNRQMAVITLPGVSGPRLRAIQEAVTEHTPFDTSSVGVSDPSSWSLSVVSLGFLSSLIDKVCPVYVLEFGSGLSTLVLAQKSESEPFQIVSVENDLKFLEEARARVTAPVSFVHAPLVVRSFGDRASPAYEIKEGELPGESPDIVLVDGPPSVLGGRRGVLYQIMPHVKPDTIIIVDDANRISEVDAIHDWQESYPGIRIRAMLTG